MRSKVTSCSEMVVLYHFDIPHRVVQAHVPEEVGPRDTHHEVDEGHEEVAKAWGSDDAGSMQGFTVKLVLLPIILTYYHTH